MARKKPSGAQRQRFTRSVSAFSGLVPNFSSLLPKRGRPKGVSSRRQKLQTQVHADLAWLGAPTNELNKWLGVKYRRDLFQFLATHLPDPDWREKRLIDGDERKRRTALRTYQGIKQRTLYREIALTHRHIWGSGLK